MDKERNGRESPALVAGVTQDELVELFGESMPIEAADLLLDAPGTRSLGELRARLRELAALRSNPLPADLEQRAREMLAEEYLVQSRKPGFEDFAEGAAHLLDQDTSEIMPIEVVAIRAIVRALSSPTMTGGVHPVFAYLLGEGALEGQWFGEDLPFEGRPKQGKHWWRKHLREALSTPTEGPIPPNTVVALANKYEGHDPSGMVEISVGDLRAAAMAVSHVGLSSLTARGTMTEGVRLREALEDCRTYFQRLSVMTPSDAQALLDKVNAALSTLPSTVRDDELRAALQAIVDYQPPRRINSDPHHDIAVFAKRTARKALSNPTGDPR